MFDILGALKVIIGGDGAELDKSLAKTKGVIDAFGAGTTKVGGALHDAFSRIGSAAGINLDAVGRAANDNRQRLDTFGSTAQKVGFAVGVGLAAVAVAAVAAGAAIVASLGKAIDRADEMNAAAAKFGVPIEQLSALKYAAEQSNVSFESLGTGLNRLNRNLADVAAGATGDASRAFDKLGISVVNADGSLKTNNQVLLEVAARFSTMQDGVGKSALAMAIFGKSGADLVPLLNEGADGITKFTERAAELGLVINKDTGVAADAFNDKMAELGKVWEGFINRLLPAILPGLVSLADYLVGGAESASRFSGAASILGNAISILVTSFIAVTTAVQVLGTSLNTVIDALIRVTAGDFSGALSTLAAGFTNVGAAVAAAGAQIKAMWVPENNPFADPAIMQSISDSINFKLNAPLLATETAAGKASSAIKGNTAAVDEWGRKIDEASVKKRASDLILGASEPHVAFRTEVARNMADLTAFGATNEQIGDVMQKTAEKYNNTWAQVAPAVAGSFAQIGGAFEKESKGMAATAKIAGIAQATISMFVGAAKALELPFPANLAAVAAVLAQGAAIVAQVKGVGGFAMGGSFRVPGAGMADSQRVMMDVSPGEQVDVWRPGDMGADPRRGAGAGRDITIRVEGEVFGQKTIRSLIDGINEALGDGARLRVA